MKSKYSIGFLFFIVFAILGCSMKEPMEQQSKFIVIKTPGLKYADMGFISNFNDRLNIQIYSSGEPLVSLDIYNDKICMSTLECMDKKSFYKKIFYAQYKNDTLENIFTGRPIFDNANLLKSENGFTQKIFLNEKYDITYSVIEGEIYFKDEINNILIKVQNR